MAKRRNSIFLIERVNDHVEQIAMQELARGRTTIRKLLPVPGRPLAFAAFAIDDPMPGLIEMPLTLGRTLTRRFKSIFGHAV